MNVSGCGGGGPGRHPGVMRVRILGSLVALLLGLSACGSGPDTQGAPAGSGGVGGVEEVKEALAALRRARTATFSAVVVHRFIDSDEQRENREAYDGTYQADAGPWGDTVHGATEVPSDEGKSQTLHWWDLGEVTVLPNFSAERDPDDPPPLPWRAYPETSEEPNPSPLTAFELIERASDARAERTERISGIELTRWKVTVPGEAANDVFGFGRYPGTAIDCTAGLPMTVWIDREGRLRRFRLVTEQYDRATFDGEFAFGDLGRPVGDDAAPPSQDQIVGSIDPQEQAAATRAAAERLDPSLRRPPNPCSYKGTPTGVDRSRCSPSSLEGFEVIDRLGRFAPGEPGTVHYRFRELTPAPVAFEVPDGLPVVDFMTRYMGPNGYELTSSTGLGQMPPGFDPTDQAAVRALLMRSFSAAEAPPPDVRLLGITLSGTWAELAVEASDCRYKSAGR